MLKKCLKKKPNLIVKNLQTFNKKLCSSYSFSKKLMDIHDLSKKIDKEDQNENISDDDYDVLVDRHNDLFQLLDRDEFMYYYNYLKSQQTIH